MLKIIPIPLEKQAPLWFLRISELKNSHNYAKHEQIAGNY